MSEALLELRFPAEPEHLSPVRAALRQRIEACGAGEACVHDVVLAVDEACQNVIRHAYGEHRSGEILLRLELEGRELILTLTDYAPPIDRSTVRPRDLDDVRPGGLGTHFIGELMDSAEFVEPPAGCGNSLRMKKRIP